MDGFRMLVMVPLLGLNQCRRHRQWSTPVLMMPPRRPVVLAGYSCAAFAAQCVQIGACRVVVVHLSRIA
jgi:hypothetical protein